jgi:hypothetical protein
LHTQVLGIAGAGVLAMALLPGVASAQSAGSSADLAALNAYHTYLGALNAEVQSSESHDALIVDGVTNTCPGALEDLNNLSSSQLKKSALTDFADEVDADLDIAYMAPSKTPLTNFASTLTGLTWSSTSQFQTTTQLISTERAMLRLAQSNICADATTLDAAPLSEPQTTGTFLKRYRRAASNLRSALGAFQSLLSKFETSSERKLVTQINSLVSQFSTQSGSTEQSDASTVMSELGVNSSSS